MDKESLLRELAAKVASGELTRQDVEKSLESAAPSLASGTAPLATKILYVLGSTPKWAASSTSQGTYPNKGAASMPKSMKYWKDWVTAVVKRYGDRYGLVNNGGNATTAELTLPPGKTSVTDLSNGVRQELKATRNGDGSLSVKINMKPWTLKTLEIQ